MSSQLEDAFNEAVERRTAELRAALEFYANADNYVGGEVGWWADAAVRDARDHAYLALQVGVPHDRIIDHLRDIWEACSAALAAADREKPPAGSDGEDRPDE